EEKPEYIGLCFDTAAPTFRDKIYGEYKGTRSETESALASQLPLAGEVVEAWGLPCIYKDGFEADDVIATLAVEADRKGIDVVIFSGDKDILQLVDGRIRVKDELKKIDFTAERVKERYGLTPKQLVDYFCLIGDKIDNVPGVPGVGDKTATKLLAQFGDLEGVYENLDQSSVSQKLLTNKDRVFGNRELIRLRTDVPLDVTATGLARRKPDPEKFPELLKRLEFRGEIYGVEAAEARPDLAVNDKRKTRVVLDDSSMKELTSALSGAQRFAYDVETDDLDKLKCGLVGVSIAVKPGEAWYVPVGHSYLQAPAQLDWKKVKAALQPYFEDERIAKCGQNLKFDDTVLECLGISVKGRQFDTMVAAYCLDPSRPTFGLKDLAADFLQERMVRIDELIGKEKGATFAHVEIERAAPYAAADAEVSLRLTDLLEKELRSAGMWDLFENLEMPLVEIIRNMETAGIAIDRDYLREIGKRFEGERQRLEREIFQLAGEEFVLNSPKQLARILFEKLKLPPSKKTKTGFSTDEDVLKKLACENPICEKIIAAREMSKLTSTYVDALLNLADDKGRVHTTFHQTGTITGRLSSSNPNLQNIPIRSENGRLIRRAFVAEPGNVLLSADYSQIDLRALAHISGDPVLIQTFLSGGDIHAATAAEIFRIPVSDVSADQRRGAKAINFGIVYGQQAFALSQILAVPIETAREFIQKYFERYAGVRAWIDATLAEARRTGSVSTLAGRRRKMDDINAPNAFTRGFAERTAVNTPIQGTSADIIKFAMIRVADALKKQGLKSRMLLQVHDELVFEVPKAELDRAVSLVRDGMEGAYPLKVPLVVDLKVGANWSEMEKLSQKKAAA
ncbi:MAG: DNA polymerase I, partial [Elusimicrobia bacterium]|nr:DNA polymerase I [Elusimicrobiota bacterium]